MDELKIEKSNKKLVGPMLVGLTSLLLGVTMLSSPEQFVGNLWNSLNLIRVTGGLFLISFWVTLFFGIKRLVDETPGLVLDTSGFTSQRGFIENIDTFAGEKILWKSVKTISKNAATSEKKVLEITFVDADKIELGENEPSSLRDIHSGPPFYLGTNDLKMDFDDLFTHFTTYHQAALLHPQQEQNNTT